MKQTGIIMSGSHPVDILEGRKTMTRRTWGLGKVNEHPDDWYLARISGFRYLFANKNVLLPSVDIKCPYGGVGDLLWIKENLYRNPYFNEAGYVADNSAVMVNGTIGDMLKWRWKRDLLPAMFMPRDASRILLEITEIRVERVQEITPQDIKAEGINPLRTDFDQPITQYKEIDRKAFITLWDSLNAKRGYSWESNCWVWVISFKIAQRG